MMEMKGTRCPSLTLLVAICFLLYVCVYIYIELYFCQPKTYRTHWVDYTKAEYSVKAWLHGSTLQFLFIFVSSCFFHFLHQHLPPSISFLISFIFSFNSGFFPCRLCMSPPDQLSSPSSLAAYQLWFSLCVTFEKPMMIIKLFKKNKK